jgi:hypothetical protein
MRLASFKQMTSILWGTSCHNAAPRIKTATYKIKGIATNTPKVSLFFPSFKRIEDEFIRDTTRTLYQCIKNRQSKFMLRSA